MHHDADDDTDMLWIKESQFVAKYFYLCPLSVCDVDFCKQGIQFYSFKCGIFANSFWSCTDSQWILQARNISGFSGEKPIWCFKDTLTTDLFLIINRSTDSVVHWFLWAWKFIDVLRDAKVWEFTWFSHFFLPNLFCLWPAGFMCLVWPLWPQFYLSASLPLIHFST